MHILFASTFVFLGILSSKFRKKIYNCYLKITTKNLIFLLTNQSISYPLLFRWNIFVVQLFQFRCCSRKNIHERQYLYDWISYHPIFVANEIRFEITRIVCAAKPLSANLSKRENIGFKNLKTNSDIVILTTDKDNATVNLPRLIFHFNIAYTRHCLETSARKLNRESVSS